MFYVIPSKVVNDKRLNANSKLLFGVIVSLNRTELGCIARNDYFASVLGVSNRSVTRYIQELAEFNYIELGTVERQPQREDIRVIVPTAEFVPSLKAAKSNINQRDKKENRQPYEPDWLDEVLNEL